MVNKISIIVPALNEEGNLKPLLQNVIPLLKAKGLNIEIVIVDDYSDDHTYEEAKRLQKIYPCVVPYRKGPPRGFGNTVRAGINVSTGEVGIVVCADNVDPIETIPRMSQMILKKGYTLVLLSRRLRKGDSDFIPIRYKFFQWLFRWASFVLLGIPFKDTTYSYRGFNLKFVKALSLGSTGFEISPEITFKTWLHRGKIGEVPGRPDHRRHIGQSKFSFLKAGKGYPRILIKAFLYRLTGKWL